MLCQSKDTDIECHVTPSAAKDRDTSDSNISDYDYSYDDDDDDDKAENGAAVMPEALVVGARRVEESTTTDGVGGAVRLKRTSDSDDVEDDEFASIGEDAERATKSRRVDSSAPAPSSSMWLRPTAVADDGPAKDGDRADAAADDRSDESPASPYQTEIKTQRPLGLLAQHRLQTSATASYRADATGRDRASAGGRGADAGGDTEEQRLREMFGRRLTHAELEAAVAMQERMSGGGFCSFPATATSGSCSGLMTSLPPTPSSAGVGLDYSSASAAARYDSLMDRRFMPSPPLSSASPCSAHDDPASPMDATTATSGHRHWTFQEQFKQVRSCDHDNSWMQKCVGITKLKSGATCSPPGMRKRECYLLTDWLCYCLLANDF